MSRDRVDPGLAAAGIVAEAVGEVTRRMEGIEEALCDIARLLGRPTGAQEDAEGAQLCDAVEFVGLNPSSASNRAWPAKTVDISAVLNCALAAHGKASALRHMVGEWTACACPDDKTTLETDGPCDSCESCDSLVDALASVVAGLESLGASLSDQHYSGTGLCPPKRSAERQ